MTNLNDVLYELRNGVDDSEKLSGGEKTSSIYVRVLAIVIESVIESPDKYLTVNQITEIISADLPDQHKGLKSSYSKMVANAIVGGTEALAVKYGLFLVSKPKRHSKTNKLLKQGKGGKVWEYKIALDEIEDHHEVEKNLGKSVLRKDNAIKKVQELTTIAETNGFLLNGESQKSLESGATVIDDGCFEQRQAILLQFEHGDISRRECDYQLSQVCK